MKNSSLSERLAYIASFVTDDMVIGDIGSDHGYLPFYLLENNIIRKAYASDNKKGPFSNLEHTFKNTTSDIELALKDGLDDLPEYVNTLLITGMGGDLIIRILEQGKPYLKNITKMILSPHTNTEGLRRYINSIGYEITDEGMVFEDKYYPVLVLKKGKQSLSDEEYKYGPFLLKKKEPVFLNMLREQKEFNLNLINSYNLSGERKRELVEENSRIDKIMKS